MNKNTSYFLKFDQKNVSNLAVYIIKVMWFNKFDQIWFNYVTFSFQIKTYLILWNVKSFVKTCIPVDLLVFFGSLIDFKWSLNFALLILVFHTPRYFEHRIFLALDNAFACYNKDTRRNQNKVINKRNSVFRFTCSSVLLLNNVIR